MKHSDGFSLVPTFGDSPSDILQHMDGQGSSPWVDPDTCRGNLQRGVRPMLESLGAFEPIGDPSNTPLALKAAARTAQQVGLSEIASVVTAQNVHSRKEMTSHLAQTVAPASPGPDVGPRGPSLG